MKVFVLAMFVLISAHASAQNLHMIEMSTNNTALGALIFSESGGDGRSENSNSTLYFGGNYAYKISPRVQLGFRGDYYRSFNDSNSESFRALVGATYNFNDDITQALYTSVYAGYSWFHYYESNVTRGKHQESIIGTVAIGKRFPLTNLNLPSVTYSPEISYTRSESNKGRESWTNNYSIRFLQFSIFF